MGKEGLCLTKTISGFGWRLLNPGNNTFKQGV